MQNSEGSGGPRKASIHLGRWDSWQGLWSQKGPWNGSIARSTTERDESKSRFYLRVWISVFLVIDKFTSMVYLTFLLCNEPLLNEHVDTDIGERFHHIMRELRSWTWSLNSVMILKGSMMNGERKGNLIICSVHG